MGHAGDFTCSINNKFNLSAYIDHEEVEFSVKQNENRREKLAKKVMTVGELK